MQKLLILLIVLLGVGLLYAKRDVWFPKLEGIGSRYQTIKSNDGTLAEGNFPLSISGGIDYATASLDDQLVILSDANFYLYAMDGTLTESRQHAYANAMLQTAGKRALIYESGGTHFRVESKYKTVYTKEIEAQIVFARISTDGYVAVVTTSDICACVLTVYDDKGKLIYTRDCVDRIEELCFNEEGDGCVAVMMQAMDGQIMSFVRTFLFNASDELWTSEGLDTLGISVYNTNDGGVFLLGDTKCAYYDNKGVMTGSYTYTSTLISGDCVNGKAALLFENETKRQSSLILLKHSTEDLAEVDFDTVVKSVLVQDGNAYVLTKSEIQAYSFGGKLKSTAGVSDSYETFLPIENYMFLMGYDKIDRTDYESE